MRIARGRIALPSLGILLLVAACSGGSGSPTSAPGGGASSDPGGGASSPSAGAPASDAPSTEPAGGGGGGTAADTCGLVTAAEMDAIFGTSGVTQELLQGPPDTCDYQLDGAPFAATVWTPDVQPYVYDAMTADPSSEAISGIGDRAVFNGQMQLLVVQKGNSLYTVAVFDDSKTEDARVELMKQIARKAAERL